MSTGTTRRLPVLIATGEVPWHPGESWQKYRRRAASWLEPARRQAERIAGLVLDPILSASALAGWATESALRSIRDGALGPGCVPVFWGDGIAGKQASPRQSIIRRRRAPAATHHSSGQGVAVAVLDSGIDSRHPLLAVEQSISTCPESPQVAGRHGTHCAGIIASRSTEHPGVAPGVRLIDVKVARSDGSTTPGWLAKGIDAALDLGAEVLSISFGVNSLPAGMRGGHGWQCREGRCILCRAVERAVACGAVVVAAAGNEHLSFNVLRARGVEVPDDVELLCPGRASAALTVGSRRADGRLSAFSSRSSRKSGKPELTAPGARVMSTIPLADIGSSWIPMGPASGTSVATAAVAGAVALLIERRRAAGRSCSPANIRREILGDPDPFRR